MQHYKDYGILMNLKNAASFLGMTRQNLASLEKTTPGFPQRIKMGGARYFRTADLLDFINSQQPSTVAKPSVVDKVKSALKLNSTYVLDSVNT